MAAPDSSINNFKLHYDVTVQGTRNVISACLECKVKKLIYTSSPSVVFDGVHGIINGDESLAYPDKYNDVYSETKAEAEAMVLRSNGREGLLTCALRPSSIFGPGDKLLVPSLVAAARAGFGKVGLAHFGQMGCALGLENYPVYHDGVWIQAPNLHTCEAGDAHCMDGGMDLQKAGSIWDGCATVDTFTD